MSVRDGGELTETESVYLFKENNKRIRLGYSRIAKFKNTA